MLDAVLYCVLTTAFARFGHDLAIIAPCQFTSKFVSIFNLNTFIPSETYFSMPGCAKSDTKKVQLERKAHDDLMAQAVAAYCTELKKLLGLKKWGARTICKDFECLNKQATGKDIKLSCSTLMRLTVGGKTRAQSNAEGCWLSDAEVDVVITFIGKITNWRFPLSHRQLKEHVDSICRAHLGDLFSVGGVGKNWTDRFVEKHSEAIKMSWS